MRNLTGTKAGRRALAAILVVAVVTVAGVVLLWPSEGETVEVSGIAGSLEGATVTEVREAPCPGSEADGCVEVGAELDDGTAIDIDAGPAELVPDVSVGDGIRVSVNDGPAGEPSYGLADFERRGPILWLAAAFALLVLAFGRLRGGLSLLGLILSLGVILAFIVPAIRDGSEPVLVAIVGSMAVMLVTISLAHGIGVKSLAAMLGTTVSLLGVALLALLFTELAHLTGFGTEEATLLASQNAVSIEGLLLAGMVIGALGVLDDVTVSQASTVIALRKANPAMPGRQLYSRAIEVGRDHISATVNTLVLAYVGASLPILLIFSAGDIGFLEALNTEVVAAEVVAMLVGSIGLIAAVPLTTALAALLGRSLPDEALAGEAAELHSH